MVGLFWRHTAFHLSRRVFTTTGAFAVFRVYNLIFSLSQLTRELCDADEAFQFDIFRLRNQRQRARAPYTWSSAKIANWPEIPCETKMRLIRAANMKSVANICALIFALVCKCEMRNFNSINFGNSQMEFLHSSLSFELSLITENMLRMGRQNGLFEQFE